jgi:hypothetical protein
MNQLENSQLEEMVVEARVGNGSAVLDGDEVGSTKDRLTGRTECAGLETPFVVAAEFHQTDQDIVRFKEKLLNLLVCEAIQPAVDLSELFVGELSEFGWE